MASVVVQTVTLDLFAGPGGWDLGARTLGVTARYLLCDVGDEARPLHYFDDEYVIVVGSSRGTR